MLTKKSGVIMVEPMDSVAHALGIMAEAGIGAILVAEDLKPVGILTERDVLKHWKNLTDPQFLAKPVGQLASSPVFCLKVDELNQVAAEMVKRRVRHVPLIDGQGGIVGIVSMRDLIEVQVRQKAIPKLLPIQAPDAAAAAKAMGEPRKILHVLTPTAELSELCRRFLPPHWKTQVWMNIRSIESLPPLKEAAVGKDIAFMLDLDGIAQDDWKSLIRKFVKLLSQAEQPVIFLTWSPKHFPEKDILSLTEVAKKAKWSAFQRPLPISELAHDLAHIDEAIATVKK